MSEMLTDLMNNIYNRISLLGKSIQTLQTSLDTLNKTLVEKTSVLVDSIKSMRSFTEKEGEAYQLTFERIGQETINQVKRLQEQIGLKDLDELMEKLKSIVDSSGEALRPETVDVLIHEVLTAVKILKGEEVKGEEGDTDLDMIGSKIAKGKSDAAAPVGKSTKSAPVTVQKPAVGNPPPAAANPPPGLAKPPGAGIPGPKATKKPDLNPPK